MDRAKDTMDQVPGHGGRRTADTMRGHITFILCTLALGAQARTAAPGWLEESLHGAGKMNTVIAVVAIILLGIGAWLFVQDRKLTRLEKRLDAARNER